MIYVTKHRDQEPTRVTLPLEIEKVLEVGPDKCRVPSLEELTLRRVGKCYTLSQVKVLEPDKCHVPSLEELTFRRVGRLLHSQVKGLEPDKWHVPNLEKLTLRRVGRLLHTQPSKSFRTRQMACTQSRETDF